jgi:hypothetical protein
MQDRRFRVATVLLLATIAVSGGIVGAAEPPGSRPLRGLLTDARAATPQALQSWKAEGGNAIVVVRDESTPRQRWSELAVDAGRAGLDLYAWIEVARNPAMADAHPDWMASPGGHHDDWRRRFPDAAIAQPGEVVKLWPWVPIGYKRAFEAHRQRVTGLLDALPGSWSGVFLNDLQAGPSACGCGNDQCRWALEYGSKATAPKTPGDDAAAQIVLELRTRYPGKAVIPVWVTECEPVDLPGAPGGTGHCGTVPCAKGSCWPSYQRAWKPLLESTPGAVAVALWADTFGRDPSWLSAGLKLFLQPSGGNALPPERAIAVLPEWGESAKNRSGLTAAVTPAGGGWVVARTRIDQSWQPRLVKDSR